MWKTVFYEFCKQRASPQQRGFLSQSKYPVLHQGAFGGMGFLFLGRLGSQASTEKKASGLIISNSLGQFFHVFWVKDFFFFENTIASALKSCIINFDKKKF